MKTVANLLLVFSVIGVLFGCLAGTAHASDYEEIGREVRARFDDCLFGAGVGSEWSRDSYNMICADIVARDLALKYRGAKLNNRFMARDGAIK